MAFVAKEWKNRLVEYAGRRKLKNVATGEEMIVDVSRQEGNISQMGDPFSAESMNDLEHRVEDEFNNINQNLIPTGGTGEMNLADQVKAIYDTLVTTAPEKAYYWTSSPVNIKDIYPDIYDRMTTGDFLVGSTGATANDNSPSCNVSGGRVGGSCSASYNNSTGILTFSGFNNKTGNGSNWNQVYNSGTLFCIWRGTINGQKI